MSREVVAQLLGRCRCEPKVDVSDELCPSEAVGAVRVAGLALGGEVQHRLGVLVLDPLEIRTAAVGDVQLALTAWVRVHRRPDRNDGARPLGGGARVAHRAQSTLMLWAEHPRLGEHQLEDRVGREVGPVDQFAQHVLVGAEGEHL